MTSVVMDARDRRAAAGAAIAVVVDGSMMFVLASTVGLGHAWAVLIDAGLVAMAALVARRSLSASIMFSLTIAIALLFVSFAAGTGALSWGS